MKYFVIGAGIWGSVIAERIASQLNRPVTVIEKRNHIGGNCYSKVDEETGIECHMYGSHIFHTSAQQVASYLSQFCSLTHYRHKVLTRHKGRVFSMPINLGVINSFYGRDFSPAEAGDFLRAEIARHAVENPANLEEKAISLIGKPLYEAFIKNYTRKQWNCDPRELPVEIINRLPFRTNYNTDYFNDPVQGVPKDGYFQLFRRLLGHPNITVELDRDYKDIKGQLPADATIIYSGLPDELFDYKYGRLAWRSLHFEWETKFVKDFQGTAVMNYADLEQPYTRIHEFKHYHPERKKVFESGKTVICYEYPRNFSENMDAYYPVNDSRNMAIHARYSGEAQKNANLVLGGRLGCYRYWDMDAAIADALECFEKSIKPFAA